MADFDDKRLARIALVVLLALGCFLVVQPFFAGILFAAVICVTSWPFYAWLKRRVVHRSTLAASLMTLLLMVVILLPMIFLVAALTDAMPLVQDKLRDALARAQVAPPDWLHRLPIFGDHLDGYWRRLAGNRDELNQWLGQLYEPARGLLLKTAALAGEGLLQVVLVLFVAFFFYRDGEVLALYLRRGAQRLGGDFGEQMLTISQTTVTSVMLGVVGTAAAQSLVALIGFYLAGLPAALLLSAATFFLSMLPVGPPLIWGGAAFWLYGQGESGWALFMVLWGLFAISSVDNFVKPLLISFGTHMPLVLVALGVFGGAFAFGFIGIFLGPPLLALALALVQHWTEATGESSAAP
jgi:predicted PurR-regulated permease PerM